MLFLCLIFYICFISQGERIFICGSYIGSPTTWMRIILVVPDLPSGTPAVMTVRSPSLMTPACRAALTAASNSSSVLFFYAT